MTKFIVGVPSDRISGPLCEQLGIDPSSVRRIVIDLEGGSAARIYYDTFADQEPLAVAFEGGLRIVGVET